MQTTLHSLPAALVDTGTDCMADGMAMACSAAYNLPLIWRHFFLGGGMHVSHVANVDHKNVSAEC